MAGQGLGCSGPSEQLDIWVLSERRRGWENKKKTKKKETDGGERTRDRVRQSDKGEEDKTDRAGRSLLLWNPNMEVELSESGRNI